MFESTSPKLAEVLTGYLGAGTGFLELRQPLWLSSEEPTADVLEGSGSTLRFSHGTAPAGARRSARSTARRFPSRSRSRTPFHLQPAPHLVARDPALCFVALP